MSGTGSQGRVMSGQQSFLKTMMLISTLIFQPIIYQATRPTTKKQ